MRNKCVHGVVERACVWSRTDLSLLLLISVTLAITYPHMPSFIKQLYLSCKSDELVIMDAKLQHRVWHAVCTQQVAIFINIWYYLVPNYLIPPPLTLDGSALGWCLGQSWPKCQSLWLLDVLPSCFSFETWSSALLPNGLEYRCSVQYQGLSLGPSCQTSQCSQSFLHKEDQGQHSCSWSQSSNVILTQANKRPSFYCLDFQISPVLDFQALSLTWGVPGAWS